MSRLGDLSIRSRQLRTKPGARTVRAPRTKPRAPAVASGAARAVLRGVVADESSIKSKVQATKQRHPASTYPRPKHPKDQEVEARGPKHPLRTKPRARKKKAPRTKPRPQQSHQAPLVPCSVESWLMNPRSSPKSTQRSKGTRQQRARDPNVRRIRKSRLGDLSIR